MATKDSNIARRSNSNRTRPTPEGGGQKNRKRTIVSGALRSTMRLLLPLPLPLVSLLLSSLLLLLVTVTLIFGSPFPPWFVIIGVAGTTALAK